MSSLSQEQFDKHFNDMVVNEAANTAMGNRMSAHKATGAIHTSIGVTCNHCDEDIEVNANYHPDYNEMRYKCPNCGEHDQSSNWFDTKMDGKMYHYQTGEEITPKNIREHLGPADPKLPHASEG